jgi:hypothetical protein
VSGFDLFLDKIQGKDTGTLVTAQEAAYRSAVMEALYEGNRQQKWIAPASK